MAHTFVQDVAQATAMAAIKAHDNCRACHLRMIVSPQRGILHISRLFLV